MSKKYARSGVFFCDNSDVSVIKYAMKKSVLFAVAAVAVGFFWAVGLCVRAISIRAVSAFPSGGMRIVVDAGHGGIDVGVSGRTTGVKESDLNLSISLLLKEELEDMGFEVVLTRKTEAGLYDTTAKGFKKRDMQRRKEIVQSANPALLVSVHQNQYAAKSVRGGQVFYASENEGGKKLALLMQEGLNELYSEEGAKGRSAKEAEYFMLTCHPCPSVIVECGFLSNPDDEKLLLTKGFQKRVARRLAQGVTKYFAEVSS